MENNAYAPVPPEDKLTTAKREAIFGGILLIFGLMLGNYMIFGGLNLGFSIALLGTLAAAVVYLLRSGCKGKGYGWALLGLCVLIIPGFARSGDGFVKFVMLCFLFVGINLGLTTLAGKNLWDPAQVRCLMEPFRAFFGLGFGKLPAAFRGIRSAVRNGGAVTKKSSAVVLGVVISVPILAVMIPLLIRSDAAFEGLLDLLPEFRFSEMYVTAIYGGGLACVLYTRTVALCHLPIGTAPEEKARKKLNSLTMNTVLLAVCALYVVYLLSQLAYFVGGFSGILPEGYNLAQYARRGFFEMAWLCIINLSVMILGVSLTEKRDGRTPLSTRLACLFIGLVTLFLVFAAGAKMVLYIGSYGMTRLRVLTMVIMIFLGLTTAVVSLWLFQPKLPYMKVILLSALVIGAVVLWTDVDTVVANYNVDAYLSGYLETVDVSHLSELDSGAVPALNRLALEAEDPLVRQMAADVLGYWDRKSIDDFRDWNYSDWIAADILKDWPPFSYDMEFAE